ncbi:hypothetical protein BKA56DRAFT_659048 [Ilyonectria sp. MPI-CAGE-AT-0026]|nr:hypothetical protein BKA56DRAFT_659048 [Ilyonectria sp. MPI-CAGE-AT-0026]
MAPSVDDGANPAFDKELAQAICDLEIPNRIRFSPDGQKVLYSTTLNGDQRKGEHPISTLWLASTAEPGSSRQLTSGLFNDTTPTWHPSGNQIAFSSDRSKPGESSAIWCLRLDGGDATPITPTENAQGIDMFAFSPNGETIAYVSADEKSPELKEKEEKNEPGPAVWEPSSPGLDILRTGIESIDSFDAKSYECRIEFLGVRFASNQMGAPHLICESNMLYFI